jgi:hypothetical protein
MLSDDASIFWKCYLRFEGDYGIRPMPLALWLDIPHEGSFRSAASGLYRDRKRWAWGIENFPVIMRGFISEPGIPIIHKVRHGCRLLFTHVGWATWPLLILVIGWLPALFAALHSPASNLPYYAVRIQSVAVGIAMGALCLAAGLSLFHLSFRGLKSPVRRIACYLLSWLLLPVFAILYGALPALDVQTRMLRGRYARPGVEPSPG